MYEFKEEDAWNFSRHVGIEAVSHGGNLHFKVCPYCRPKPTKGNVKTFAIDLKTGRFKCLRASCGVTGNMITLSKDFDFSLGNEVDEYYRPKRRFRRMKKPDRPIKPKPQAIEYLTSRGISEEVIKRYQITVQTEHPNILVFPFFDQNGEMQFVKYRKTDFDKERDTNKEWCEANTKPILFGIMQCTSSDRIVITEGQIDSLSVAEAGIKNAVSVPTGAQGFTWVPYCWDWLKGFKEIVVFGDYENGSISLLDELKKRFKTKIKHVREEDYRDCKDANEILLKYGKGQVRKCVEDAVSVPVSKVIELADVKDVDIFKLDKLSTGINQIDRLLYGGLPFGGVILVSGKPGEGKSTLASQIMANAVEQGHKCFAYSGELPNYQFKSWIGFQLAGPQHVVASQNKFGDMNYNVSRTNRALIDDWYRGKFFIYDSTDVDGEETESLCKTAESVILQYGVRVILLDNLMTALDLESMRAFDKYDKQSLFVKRLARMALKYDVMILLVAHKRKNNFSTNENDEVSGSGDISNLALVTLAYERSRDLEDDQRLCKISKNRLFGRVNTKGYVLDFDPRSKRIYGAEDDANREFGWGKDMDGFVKADDEMIPFD